MKKLISIGECMLELSSVKDDIWKMGIAGDTLNTSWYARACLSKNWSVLFATKIGKDVMSSKVINFDKEEIDVLKDVQGKVLSKGTISIVGLPDEYK